MILADLFEISYGQKMYHSKSFLDEHVGSVPLISSGYSEHGIYGIFDIKPKFENVISVASTGSVGWAFYHNYKCCIDDNCLVLKSKKDLSEQQMIYITMLINKDRYRYMYGRQVTPVRIGNIILPEFPDFVEKTKLQDVSRVKNKLSNKKLNLLNQKWKWFEYKTIFDIKKGKRLTKHKMTEGVTPFVGSSDSHNGITAYVGQEAIHDENTITVAYDGSVGEAFYQNRPFWALDSVNVLYPKFKLNKFIAMFIVALIRKEKYRFSYGRKWHLERMKESKIKLPVDKNRNPDWKFMEDYIKSLPYSAEI